MWDRKKANTLDMAKLEFRDLPANHSRLGPSLLVKGEISGDEDLLIDGSVEGVVRLGARKLLIGPGANVKANITAGEVLVRGNVKGNVCANGRIEIRNYGSVTGDLKTPQVVIEDGSWFKGLIEKSTPKETGENALSEIESAPAKASAAAAGANNVSFARKVR